MHGHTQSPAYNTAAVLTKSLHLKTVQFFTGIHCQSLINACVQIHSTQANSKRTLFDTHMSMCACTHTLHVHARAHTQTHTHMHTHTTHTYAQKAHLLHLILELFLGHSDSHNQTWLFVSWHKWHQSIGACCTNTNHLSYIGTCCANTNHLSYTGACCTNTNHLSYTGACCTNTNHLSYIVCSSCICTQCLKVMNMTHHLLIKDPNPTPPSLKEKEADLKIRS